jgi:hypothetical protein
MIAPIISPTWMPSSPNSQPPIKGPDNADDDVANEAKAAAAHNLPGKPAGNGINHEKGGL